MNLYQKIIASGIILGTLTGCDNSENKPLEETLRGEPISVQVAGGSSGEQSISTVIRLNNGNYELCGAGEGFAPYYNLQALTDAAAMIESEMRDGDSEPVEIKGYRVEGNRFKMKSVSANGFIVNIYKPNE